MFSIGFVNYDVNVSDENTGKRGNYGYGCQNLCECLFVSVSTIRCSSPIEDGRALCLFENWHWHCALPASTNP